MKSMGRHVGRILRYFQDKTGVSAVEYALIVVAVVGIVGAGVAMLSGGIDTIFENAVSDLSNAGDKIDSEVAKIKKGT